jgi:hypothetical protein
MDIRQQLKEKKLLKRDVCAHLGCTMPTLKSKLDEPTRLTISDIRALRELGIEIKV